MGNPPTGRPSRHLAQSPRPALRQQEPTRLSTPTVGTISQSDLHRNTHLATASSCNINLRNEVVYPCYCLVKRSDSGDTQLCRIIKRFPPLIFNYIRWPGLHLSVGKQSDANLAKRPKVYRLVGYHELQIDKVLNTLTAWLGETVQFLRNLHFPSTFLTRLASSFPTYPCAMPFARASHRRTSITVPRHDSMASATLCERTPS